VLQQTERSQTAVMTIAPGEDGEGNHQRREDDQPEHGCRHRDTALVHSMFLNLTWSWTTICCFNALVEDLVKALDQFKVGATEKNELLGALGPMKGDIVGQ